MGPSPILYILLTTLRAAGALRVSMKTSPVSALRGQDVTIPCDIYELNLQSPMAVLWIKRLDNGTEYNVYKYEEDNVVITRPGAHMDKAEIKRGNASLYIPQLQFSDEGEYICKVINTPDKEEGKTSLEVSVPPLADVTPLHPIIELGTEKTMTCDVYNFYPQGISIRWAQYRKGSTDCEILEIWTCVKNLRLNSDGTYNVTSLLTLNPKKDDHGNRYSCLISHRALQSELSRSITLTVTERKDNVAEVITAVVVTLLLAIFIALLGFLYFTLRKKAPPILSAITGEEKLIDMTRTTLTCQIMNFRPNDITICVCIRSSGDEIRRTLYTWRSGGHPTPARGSRHNGGGNRVDEDVEQQIPLVNGGVKSEDGPLQLEMVPEISRKRFGRFNCQCVLKITPSYDRDNGAELSVHVKHPALTCEVSVCRNLNVIGVPPKLLSIMSPDCVIHGEKVTLTFPILGFKPLPLSITWLKRDPEHGDTDLVTWNSGNPATDGGHQETALVICNDGSPATDGGHQETALVTWNDGLPPTDRVRYSHDVKKVGHDDDKSRSFISALTMTANVGDDGVTYICRTSHPATQHRAEEDLTLRVIAVPVLDAILKTPTDDIHVGHELRLSCKIHSFYPSEITVTWYKENEVIATSHTTEPLGDAGGLYHVISDVIYTPTISDLGRTFRCEVQHCGLWEAKRVSTILTDIVSPPTLGNIRCDPAHPELDKPVTLSCPIRDMCPGNPDIFWYWGVNKFKPHQWKTTIQQDPVTKIFSGTAELTFTLTSEKCGAPICLKIIHKGKTIQKIYQLLLAGLPVLSEISLDPSSPDYGNPLTLRCDVTGCNPGDAPRVTWLEGDKELKQGKQTWGIGDVLHCHMTIRPTVEHYGKVYTCSVIHGGMKNPIVKSIRLNLPERSPILSDIVVHPARLQANHKASFQITISGFSSRDLQITWYWQFNMLPQSDVSISDPTIGLDGLYTSSSTLAFTPMMSDDKTSIRCEVKHRNTIREKQYILDLTGKSDVAEVAVGPERTFHIREIRCVTERPQVAEEVTLVAYIEGCRVDTAKFSWVNGVFPVDEPPVNQQDGPDCTSTVTFIPEESNCPITLEVTYNFQTVGESFTLQLV